MLIPLPVDDCRTIRTFFEQSGYTEPHLRRHLGAAELPSPRLRNMPRLLDRTSEPSTLNVLLRWFWLALPQKAAEVAGLVPDTILRPLLQAGLLVAKGDSLHPAAMLLPTDEFLVAADHPSAIERKQGEMVLWPNPTSKFLARFAIRRHSRATLDLGTGSGILSLWAAAFSDTVVATDLNVRAVDCARFNARLNGIENMEVLAGDLFSPVEGRRFDLILSNPPFFITPQADYMFCDNPLELDDLCRKLVRQAPAYLNEDGYLEMLCEWAQVKGQSWEERLAEWLEGTGCDAWVLKGLTQDPEEYAQHRISETSQDTSQDAASYRGYMDYYRRRGVEAIHDGLIVLRRREGVNFIRLEEVPSKASGALGDLILGTFAAHDLLREHENGGDLLGLRLRLSENARLEQVARPGPNGWAAESMVLRLIGGFPFRIDVQPLVAEFLAMCDGNRTVREAIEAFSRKVNAPPERAMQECVAILRKLIERGFVVAALDRNAPEAVDKASGMR
jgi:methylase of polypeptide subunit release factors